MKFDLVVISYARCTLEKIDGFMHRLTLSGGHLNLVDSYPMDRGMYCSAYEDKLFVIYRCPFIDDDRSSGFSAFRIRNGKTLRSSSEMLASSGEVGCHISADSKSVFAANYISGNICKADWHDDGNDITYSNFKHKVHSGKCNNNPRQQSPHCHFAGIKNDYLFVADLGLDTVFVYDRELNLKSFAKVPDGYGARHLAFSDDLSYIYCVNELVSSISVFGFKNGVISYIKTVLCPLSGKKENTAAAIRLYNGLLIISNRGDNTLCSFDADGENLSFRQSIDCGGRGPRDFNITDDGKYLVCANEKSDNLTVFEIQENEMKFVSQLRDIKAPLAVEFI